MSGQDKSQAKGPSESDIQAELAKVNVPGGGDLISRGMVTGVAVLSGAVYFSIEVDPALAETFEPIRRAAVRAVEALGVEKVQATLTAHSKAPAQGRPARQAPAGNGRGNGHNHADQAHGQSGKELVGIKNIKKIITVASGKGGVGKSTVAVNLAVALSNQGKSVGLLDADIYGPSIPRMVGLNQKPKTSDDGKVMLPLEAHGLKLMSIGFLIGEDTPMIWRGPMVQSALLQMMRDVDWGTLDVLIIDMPPGTGDAALTIAQQTPVAGAVIVSTPQDIALIDARKAIGMFEKVHVPVLGIVENMSYFHCPHCGERSEIFGHGGARADAASRGIPFLGEVPLHAEIREKSDRGIPVAGQGGDQVHELAFESIATQVFAAVEAAGRPAPKMTIQ